MSDIIKRMPVPKEALTKNIEEAKNQIANLRLQLAELDEKEKLYNPAYRKSLTRSLRLNIEGRIMTLQKQQADFELKLARVQK